MTSWEWYRSEERARLQKQQADMMAGMNKLLFIVLGIPSVALVFIGEKVETDWLRYAVYGAAAVLGSVLLVKTLFMMREHSREVKRIDEEGEARFAVREHALERGARDDE